MAQLHSTLADGEQGGISEHSPDDIRSGIKERLRADGQLLHFLVEDLAAHPERLQAVDAGLVQRIKSLVGDVNVDLDEPLPENDE